VGGRDDRLQRALHQMKRCTQRFLVGVGGDDDPERGLGFLLRLLKYASKILRV